MLSTLVRDVLPWFAGFFLLDALVHLLRGQLVFSRIGFEPVEVLRTGLRLVGVTPFGLSVVAYEQPFLATPRGLWLFDPAVQSTPPVVEEGQLRFVAWDALGPLEVSRTTLRSRDQILFRARSVRDAKRLRSLLVRLRDLPTEERDAALEAQAAQAFDVGQVRERWRRVRMPARLAALFGTLETLVLFGMLPVLAYTPEVDEARWLLAFGTLLGLHILAIGCAAWTFARWGLPGDERSGALFQMLLLPVYAARAGVQATRDAFSEFEPLAIAGALLRPADFARFARRERVRAEEGRVRAQSPELAAYFEARLVRIDAVLDACGTGPAQVMTRPVELAAGATYCPLCLAEYRTGFTVCSDCTVALVSGAPDASEAPRAA